MPVELKKTREAGWDDVWMKKSGCEWGYRPVMKDLKKRGVDVVDGHLKSVVASAIGSTR